jgi:hypothetical protein
MSIFNNMSKVFGWDGCRQAAVERKRRVDRGSLLGMDGGNLMGGEEKGCGGGVDRGVGI